MMMMMMIIIIIIQPKRLWVGLYRQPLETWDPDLILGGALDEFHYAIFVQVAVFVQAP